MSPRPDRRPPAHPLLTCLRPPRRAPGARPDTERVYAVHPGALASGNWRDLAAALPEDTGFSLLDLQAVPEFTTAALRPAGSAADDTEPGVTQLARRCLTALTADLPPQAPFRLVGWSFGGVVAYEMAVQLASAGRGAQLRDLVLLDSIAPVHAFKRPDELLDPRMLLRWFAMYLGAKRGAALRVDLPPGTSLDTGLDLLLEAATAQGVLPPDTEAAGLRKLYGAYAGGLSRNNRCTTPYTPAPLDRLLTLVKPQGSLLPDRGDLGWSELTPHPVRRLTVPGDHYTMLHEPAAVPVVSGLLAEPAPVA
jgi:thioesterase domain-containing protein